MAKVDPEKREQWDYQLELPLPGQEDREPSQAQVEAEGEQFMALLGATQAMRGGADADPG